MSIQYLFRVARLLVAMTSFERCPQSRKFLEWVAWNGLRVGCGIIRRHGAEQPECSKLFQIAFEFIPYTPLILRVFSVMLDEVSKGVHELLIAVPPRDSEHSVCRSVVCDCAFLPFECLTFFSHR